MRQLWVVFLALAILVVISSATHFGQNENVKLSTSDDEVTATTLKLKSKSWSAKGTSPEVVLYKLQAAGMKLDEKNMFSWLENVLQYRAAKGVNDAAASDLKIFTTLTKKLSEDEIPLLLVAMTKNSRLVKLSKSLQLKQYDRWLDQGISLGSAQTILGLKTVGKTQAQLGKEPPYSMWLGYMTKFDEKVGLTGAWRRFPDL